MFSLLTLSYHSATSHSWCQWPGLQPHESQSEQSHSLWIPSHHTQPTTTEALNQEHFRDFSF